MTSFTFTPCYVLTCAPGSRAEQTEELWDALRTAPNRRVVVTTQPDPITESSGHIEVFDSIEINISKWWTQGLDYIARVNTQPFYDVFVVESDVRITADELEGMRQAMRSLGVACVGAEGPNRLPFGKRWRVDLINHPRPPRLFGVGLLVRGELNIRHDPEMRWWYADDDFELQHRAAGGTAMLAGVNMEHATGTPMVGERLRYAAEDEIKFKNKWRL